VLWPFGSDAQPTGVSNPYADLPPLNFPALREAASFSPTQVFVQEWNHDARDAAHQILMSNGEVSLVFGDPASAAIRPALLDLQSVPVEDGTMFVHPVVVAVLDFDTNPEVWLRLQGWHQ
jgi:hypothetical protein